MAEALWFAIDLAVPEEVKDPRESTVVIGADKPGLASRDPDEDFRP